MTLVWVNTNDLDFIGYYCPACRLEFEDHEVLGSMFCPICPNCKLEIFPLYDVKSTAIHAIEEDENNAEGN